MVKSTKNLKQLYNEFLTDEVASKFSFIPYATANGLEFYTNASLEEALQYLPQFIILSVEQKGKIILSTSFIEGVFEIKYVSISYSGLKFVCCVKEGSRVTHRNKKIRKLQQSFINKYKIKCEVEVIDQWN